MNALDKRVQSVFNKEIVSTFKVFDAATLVALEFGSMTHKGMTFLMEGGEQDEYGVEECKRIFKICSRLKHIQSS